MFEASREGPPIGNMRRFASSKEIPAKTPLESAAEHAAVEIDIDGMHRRSKAT